MYLIYNKTEYISYLIILKNELSSMTKNGDSIYGIWFIMSNYDILNTPNKNSNIYSLSITQLVGTCIVICRGRSSNPGHPTYSP